MIQEAENGEEGAKCKFNKLNPTNYYFENHEILWGTITKEINTILHCLNITATFIFPRINFSLHIKD